MRKNGFTLIELAVACLVASILLHSIFNLLHATLRSFSHQEEYATCTWQGSLLSSYLQEDLEDAFLHGSEDFFPRIIESVIKTEVGFTLPLGDKLITYEFDPGTRLIRREKDGNKTKVGQGLVHKFNCTPKLQLSDGTITSPDEVAVALAAAPELGLKRIWFEFEIILKTDKNDEKEILHNFSFNGFPVRLNRQLQSIWKN